MGILDEDIARVREASDIVGVIGEHVALKRSGRRWQGLCPFHAEKTPSFSVNQEEGLYYCFGCSASGDVITFVREIDHVDFVGAVESLASRSGIPLRFTEQSETETRRRRSRLVEAVEQAIEWYHERLLSGSDAAEARGYLRSRGFDGDDVRRYRLGWAPDAWDGLSRALRLPDDVLVDAGLGYLNASGRLTDAFRGRIMFPVLDVRGDAVGFGGRILPGRDGPKYKNSTESALYAKSRILYGLSWAKREVVAADEVVVCEGYTDVIAFAKAGVPRAVATCGTALTEEHVRLLRRFARRVVLAFDADSAGRQAAERFYVWERSLDLDVAVAVMPVGLDPAELALTDPDRLRVAVSEAVPFLRFRVDSALGSQDLTGPEGRARAAEAAMAVVAEHPSPLVRDQYLMEVASRCRIDPNRLRSIAAGGGTRRASGRAGAGSGAGSGSGSGSRAETAVLTRDTPETEALRVMVHCRDDIESWLEPVLFADPVTAEVYSLLTVTGSLREALDAASDPASVLMHRLAVEESEADPVEVASRLVDAAVQRALGGLGAEVRAATDPDPDLFARRAQETAWLKLLLEELREPATVTGAMEQLLPWLVSRSEVQG